MGPGPRWTSIPQEDYLQGLYPGFLEARAEKKLPAFWDTANGGFFAGWENPRKEAEDEYPKPKKPKKGEPEREREIMTDDALWVQTRKKQIKTWFTGRASKEKDSSEKVNLRMPAKTRRVPAAAQIFVQKYYDEEQWKANIDEKMQEGNLPGRNWVAVMNECGREAFKNADSATKEAVKREVEARRRVLDEKKLIQEELLEHVEGRTYTNAQRAEAVEMAPELMKQFVDQIGPRTGWSYCVVGGGPDPSHPEGGITTMAYHYRETAQGYTFSKVNPAMVQMMLTEFSAFCHLVTLSKTYPTQAYEERIFRSIAPSDEVVNTKEAITRAKGVPVVQTYPSRPVLTEEGEVDEDVVTVRKPKAPKGSKKKGKGKGKGKQQANMRVGGLVADSEEEGPSELEASQARPGPSRPDSEINTERGEQGIGADAMEAGRAGSPGASAGPRSITEPAGCHVNGAQPLGPPRPGPCLRQPGGILRRLSGRCCSSRWMETTIQRSPVPVQNGSDPDPTQGESAEDVNLGGGAPFVAKPPENEAEGASREGDLAGRPKRAREESDEASGEMGERRAPRQRREKEPDEWLSAARDYLECDLDDVEWRECVMAWFNFECDILDSTGQRLTHQKFRPEPLNKWLGTRPRRYQAVPEISDMPKFIDEWLTWWKELQPAPRKNYFDNDLPAPLQAKHDLLAIKKGGLSGLVTVLIGLKWWSPVRTTDKCWVMAVSDMKACFMHFRRR
ncbi:hypothetical protein DFP72DRAFT_858997 [Ephemerocybe angulata]|uniref:Uncharacterized protein n=1 Tax=Ephemerocybe angulata TaxID=980116 RepID=A0A8H6HAC2_9AGAR|nr:hypothetical protein DFP72DRAFT_858997 [Tulosesus angulatus]